MHAVPSWAVLSEGAGEGQLLNYFCLFVTGFESKSQFFSGNLGQNLSPVCAWRTTILINLHSKFPTSVRCSAPCLSSPGGRGQVFNTESEPPLLSTKPLCWLRFYSAAIYAVVGDCGSFFFGRINETNSCFFFFTGNAWTSLWETQDSMTKSHILALCCVKRKMKQERRCDQKLKMLFVALNTFSLVLLPFQISKTTSKECCIQSP